MVADQASLANAFSDEKPAGNLKTNGRFTKLMKHGHEMSTSLKWTTEYLITKLQGVLQNFLSGRFNVQKSAGQLENKLELTI